MVWDNCGPHKVPAVAEVLEEWGIVAEELPPRMTDILQVMDLIVNGPVKAGIRRARVTALFNFFQGWKIERLQHIAAKRTTLPPEFKPPKPTQAQGLLIVFQVMKETLETPAFEESMRKCFQIVGLAPAEDGSYSVYSPTKKGVLENLIPQVAQHHDAVSVGEIASELAMTSRPLKDPSAAGPSEDAEESSSDGSDGEAEDVSSESGDE